MRQRPTNARGEPCKISKHHLVEAGTEIHTKILSQQLWAVLYNFFVLALICRTDKARFVLSAEVVTRIVGAATWLPLEGLPNGVVGVLNLAGANLPVVDPRQRLGQAQTALGLEHHLIEIHHPRRYLLWVDAVESSLELNSDQIENIATAPGALAHQLVRFSDETLPLVRSEAFDPGELVGR
jgi:chemotaxis signal transduction protein